MHGSGYNLVMYRPAVPKARFNFLVRNFYDNQCYNDEELRFRDHVLQARAGSQLSDDLLVTKSTWFASDGLINTNERSWWLNDAFKPRHTLSAADFHVSIIDKKLLRWEKISILSRQIGDYLELRNKNLSADYLNQPINFVLLDIKQILLRLAVLDSAEKVNEQLPLLMQYIRNIETQVNTAQSSDRLFLADCREYLEHEGIAEINTAIQSRQIKDRLVEIERSIDQLGTDRNTLLHFALSEGQVNPHPYWENFAQELIDKNDMSSFPTLIARKCLENKKLSADEHEVTNAAACPELKLIELNHDVYSIYQQAVADLQELYQFKLITRQLSSLSEQVGELYMITQFKAQIIQLVDSLERFVSSTQLIVTEVHDANEHAYHEYIKAKQDLRWWQRWLTNQERRLNDFIANQDHLTKFKVKPTDLDNTVRRLRHELGEFIEALHRSARTTELAIADHPQIKNMMDTMYLWVANHHQRLGLPLPSPVLLLTPSTSPLPVSLPRQVSSSFFIAPPYCIKNECKDKLSIAPQKSNLLPLAGALLFLLPLSYFIYLIIYRIYSKSSEAEAHCSADEFAVYQNKSGQLLAQGFSQASTCNSYFLLELEQFEAHYNDLKHYADKPTRLQGDEMARLCGQLEDFIGSIEEMTESPSLQ